MIRFLAVLLAVAGIALVSPADDEPSKPLKPTPLAVNTEQDEDDPNISSDNLKFYFVRAGKEKAEVFLSVRRVGTAWGKATAMENLKTKTANVRSPFISPEGRFPQYLYFASDKDPEKKGQQGDNFDLYFLIKQFPRADWTTETALATIGTEADEINPWLSPTGQYLFFSRKDKDGWHVYQSTRPGAVGQFGAPVKLDLPVNFHHATLMPDLRTMYLQGPLDEKAKKPRWGLFRCAKTGKKWSKPEPLTMLNHPDGPTGDMSPCLSRDGTYLYFASDRPGGKGGLDLYAIAVSRLKKEK